jgi:hypothetical protein
MEVKIKDLSGAILSVLLCFCFSACDYTGENDSSSGLANEKSSNRDLGLAEYGDYVYFVRKTMKLNPDGSSAILMRFERDGSNLVLPGDTEKYTVLFPGRFRM